jgi:hypothetical protein
MLKTLIDTENKTVIVKQEFLIDELMGVLQQHNAWDYKIIIEKEIVKEYPPINVPFSQPCIKPWWEQYPIMYHNVVLDPIPYTTTSTTTSINKNIK